MGQTLIISNFQGAISNKSVVVSLHKMIKKVTEDIPALKFNTAIAECMIFMNTWEKAGAEALSREDLEKFLLILAPYAPYMTEELWSQLGHSESIHTNRWPAYDSSLLITDTVEIPVQVNGKVRGIVTASRNEIGEEWKIVELAKENPAIQKHLLGDISKTIYVPGKILNIICK
jgi:leucyl-tRNA synthetase